MTGSGKTEVLHEMIKMGHQVLDLEGVANHKGSVFGALGQADQPTNENFENELAEHHTHYASDHHNGSGKFGYSSNNVSRIHCQWCCH